MPYKDIEKQREWQRIWAKKKRLNDPYKHREVYRKYRWNVRLRVIEQFGGKCVYCGCNIPEALEINHINGGGAKEKRETNRGEMFYLDILKGRRNMEDLELTCIVCNAWHKATKIKGIEDHWKIVWNK